jgi:type II secretory pathway pseudopilin PulG
MRLQTGQIDDKGDDLPLSVQNDGHHCAEVTPRKTKAMFARYSIREETGFTIMELMVVLGIFMIVVAGVISFYQHQSREGLTAARKKLAEEAARLAMMTMTKDIMQAGLGLEGRENLAMFVSKGASASIPDAMYLSYSYHLDMDRTGDKANSFYDGLSGGTSTPGLNKVWFLLAGTPQITLKDVNTAIDYNSMCSLITDTSPFYVTLQKTNFTDSQSGSQDTQNRKDITIAWTGLPNTGTISPAISYTLSKAKDTLATGEMQYYPMGRLLRNDVPVLGADSKELRPLIKVTDFQIRCRFRGDTGSDGDCIECPDPTGTPGWTQTKLKDLRLLEITLRYIWRSPGAGFATPDSIPDTMRDAWSEDASHGGYRLVGDLTPGPWSSGGVQRFTVSPRNIVMTQYLGEN